ncbi:FAD dependent oxidoreductase [Rhodopirellula maiorica SM1]|uniref:FAD dependent oxidoreductase n=1 Tax=Rhodopirellula maiorica SM1 TaxID=1265738 RepID=M5RR58_9BACT|nr:FAD dependent oxidoreductase [Rhodopirellula maiorica SM1]
MITASTAINHADATEPVEVEADLLIVGGTESGCAAAVQAARMGVQKIVLVNDIDWLGGQFSAEGLGAIDENRAHKYNGTVPIPRSGLFREVIDKIETKNAELYGGIRRPGNTRVITTARPVVSESVFRDLLAPYERSGQIQRFSDFRVARVIMDNHTVRGAEFVTTDATRQVNSLVVHARMTIDASDWGDVIQASGARWDTGIDAQAEFGEPRAPQTNQPTTDLAPITYCMILVEQDQESLYPEPETYDPRYFTGTWGWIQEEFAYTTRRLVDGKGFTEIDHPDVLLINSPQIDYPLDSLPANVVAELERNEVGASKKTLVAMTAAQREIVFRDAKRHTLRYYYHLQQNFPKFRRMALSNEFGTSDRLPPKPYVRESLRLVARHIVREQEVDGFGGYSNYATTMFPDAVFSWQFEKDFHPTQRTWVTDKGNAGPWEATFRGKRRFGLGGTGLAVFPLRSLVPEKIHGLLGAQKNLGYTSIVGSSCRLHDQSMHVGQASGAVAAISLRNHIDPAAIYLRPDQLAQIWEGLLHPDSGVPLAIWPFSDTDPYDDGFVAIQQLALRRLLGLGPTDTAFQPDQIANNAWLQRVQDAITNAGYSAPSIEFAPTATRRDVAISLWNHLKSQPVPDPIRIRPSDADDDGISDVDDPLPFTAGTVSWQRPPETDGIPSSLAPFPAKTIAINFTSAKSATVAPFRNDVGHKFSSETGYGWQTDLGDNTRWRATNLGPLRDGFVFTRKQDVWQCEVDNGKWRVHVCMGDAAHEQTGQFLQVENVQVAEDVSTPAGVFHEATTDIEVNDGHITLTLGTPSGGNNTTINWLIAVPVPTEELPAQ